MRNSETEEVSKGKIEVPADDDVTNKVIDKSNDFGDVSLNESGTIPQLDGVGDSIETRDTYCKVCKECPDEIETSEDISYDVMNDHDTNEVLAAYGQELIQERKYCIRKWSPFENWFSTPFIS